ncbi:6079_t:CDS:2, partial [Funneliformis geosporum]
MRNILRKPWEFAEVINQGKKVISAEFRIFYSPNQLNNCQWGISTPQKLVKKATQRNYYKRQIKSILAQHKDSICQALTPKHYNLLIIIRPGFLTSQFSAKQSSLTELLNSISSAKSLFDHYIWKVSAQVIHYQEYIRGESNIGDRKKIEVGAQNLTEIEAIEKAILDETKVQLQKKGQVYSEKEELRQTREKLKAAEKRAHESQQKYEEASKKYIKAKQDSVATEEERDNVGKLWQISQDNEETRKQELENFRQQVITNIQNELKRAELNITKLDLEFKEDKNFNPTKPSETTEPTDLASLAEERERAMQQLKEMKQLLFNLGMGISCFTSKRTSEPFTKGGAFLT